MNQPIRPLYKIGTEMAKKSDAKRPAVVPPMVLTIANITIAVADPMTTGNIIVKSYNSEPAPKI